MFGFHIWPRLETGKIATKAGVISAGMNFFEVKVRGKGGHAAMPSGAIDPFIPVANMILAYQVGPPCPRYLSIDDFRPFFRGQWTLRKHMLSVLQRSVEVMLLM